MNTARGAGRGPTGAPGTFHFRCRCLCVVVLGHGVRPITTHPRVSPVTHDDTLPHRRWPWPPASCSRGRRHSGPRPGASGRIPPSRNSPRRGCERPCPLAGRPLGPLCPPTRPPHQVVGCYGLGRKPVFGVFSLGGEVAQGPRGSGAPAPEVVLLPLEFLEPTDAHSSGRSAGLLSLCPPLGVLVAPATHDCAQETSNNDDY